jgi:hypothetical protein
MQCLFSPLVLYRCLKTNFAYSARQANRSSEIYLSPECRNIVGEDVTKVLQLPEEDATANSNEAAVLGLPNPPSYYNRSF